MKLLTHEEHIERHKILHKEIDELIADYINCTKRHLSDTNLIQFITWSYEQTINPTDIDEDK
jgi:hypothetical protein